jgi:hypothetical protein
MLFAALGVVALLALGAVGFFLTRGPSLGFLMVNVDLPAEVRAHTSVTLTTQAGPQAFNPPASWPMLEKVAAGPVVVLVSAEGYTPFTQTVQVAAGQQVTRVDASLKRLVKTASLVLTTKPADAQVKVDGKVVRAQGASDVFLKDVKAGDELLVEVSAPGFKPFTKKFAHTGDEPVQVKAELEADGEASQYAVRVESVPAGATIFADGEDTGAVTPATVKVPASVKQVKLRLKCYTDATLPVEATDDGTASVKGSLKRLPRCR